MGCNGYNMLAFALSFRMMFFLSGRVIFKEEQIKREARLFRVGY